MRFDKSIPLLEAKSINKFFSAPANVEILKNIDFKIFQGESIAIIGRSGEGKSTLLQILGTLEDFSSGDLYLSGEKITASNKARIRNLDIGFVFQSFHLLEDYSVLENVLMPAKINRQPTHKGSKAFERGCELLEKVGLSERKHFQSRLLSGGEKQRVAIARAMCNDPSLILADEPSGNLDKETALIIHDLLLSFSRQPGKGLLIVTHDLNLANLCSKQCRLEAGRLIT